MFHRTDGVEHQAERGGELVFLAFAVGLPDLAAVAVADLPTTQLTFTHALLSGGPAGACQHVGLWVNVGNGAHPAGDRQGQLAGAAAEIDNDVDPGQPERVHHVIDDGRRVTTPVPVVEICDLTAEPQVHAACRRAPVRAVALLTA